MEAGTEMNIKKFFDYLFYLLDGDIRLCVTIVEKDLAITADHCIPKDKTAGDLLTIYNQSGKAYKVKIIFRNKELDLALLLTVEKEFEIEPLEVGLYEVGTNYIALGYPLDEDTGRQFIKSPNAIKGCIMTRVVRKNCVYGDSGGSKGLGGLVISLDRPPTLIGIALGGRGLPKTWPLNDFLIRALNFCGETPRLKILPASTALACATTANVERRGVKRRGTDKDIETTEKSIKL